MSLTSFPGSSSAFQSLNVCYVTVHYVAEILGRAWEQDQDVLGMRLGCPGNETRMSWERD